MTTVKQLEKKISLETQNKHFDKFTQQARFKGNGVYFIPMTDLYSNDTRELFLMFCAAREGIIFKT